MTKNSTKESRAALHPGRPGAMCRADPGVFRPEVNVQRCEGKGDCVAVCPYGVFEVGRIADPTFKAQPLRVRLKLWAHGKQTAYTPYADASRACGLCVIACPENAIKLVGPSSATA